MSNVIAREWPENKNTHIDVWSWLENIEISQMFFRLLIKYKKKPRTNEINIEKRNENKCLLILIRYLLNFSEVRVYDN